MIRWFRRVMFRRQAHQLARVLRRIEATQKALGWPKWKRDKFWREFKYGPKGREAVIQILRGVN